MPSLRARSATPNAAPPPRPGTSSYSSAPRSGSAARAPALTKQQIYERVGNEDINQLSVTNPALCKRVAGFNMERQIPRDQRARGMCRIADRTFHSLSYNPVRSFGDKHEAAVDLRRHCGRKFDQSAGFFTPISAHLAYETGHTLKYLDMHQHGNVEFGKLPAAVPEADRVKARLFESAIFRRKHSVLYPTGEVPCPYPKLSREQQAQAVQPQAFFRSTRGTKLAQASTNNEVDATCGTLEVQKAAISSKFVNRNLGHNMAGDCTREDRERCGHFSGHEKLLSRNLAPLRIKYSYCGGKGFMKYIPIGEDPKQQISFGHAPRMRVELREKEAIARTTRAGSTDLVGNPTKAFDASRRKTTRNISLGPGFKSQTEEEDYE